MRDEMDGLLESEDVRAKLYLLLWIGSLLVTASLLIGGLFFIYIFLKSAGAV
ncbi:MAG: hypothetical protein U9N48_03965 [Euryarchaeota archaeon]|nr:hypothetical protein [Euryarchaeota archaeon]